MLSYGAYNQVITCLEGDLPKQQIFSLSEVEWDALLRVHYMATSVRQKCDMIFIWGERNPHAIFVLNPYALRLPQ